MEQKVEQKVEQKITYRCTECGSDDVKLDAWAAWCNITQQWELCDTFDHAYCEQCGGETNIEEAPYEDWEEDAA